MFITLGILTILKQDRDITNKYKKNTCRVASRLKMEWVPKKMSPKMKIRKRKLLFSDKLLKSTMTFLVFCSKEQLKQLKRNG